CLHLVPFKGSSSRSTAAIIERSRSFHDFPSDDQLRARWVTAIRRDEGAMFKILCGSTYVCSLHFNNDDIYSTPTGFRCLGKLICFPVSQ
uniref:THAP-type domain-containing protein n=1 Tax=Seriola dumerili TaxID=41447 RepID=A0A3B4VNS5_SERDU